MNEYGQNIRAEAKLPPPTLEDIEAALAGVVPQIQELADLLTVGIASDEHAQDVIAKARALHSEIGAGISAAEEAAGAV